MMGFVTRTVRKARKDHPCYANAMLGEYTIEDLLDARQRRDARLVEKVKRAMSAPIIPKGSIYVHYSGRGEDGFFSVRSNLEADEVCIGFDLYSEG